MKTYLLKDVYSAAQERFAFLNDSFDQVVVAFSGGKDSTLCLWLTLECIKNKPIIIYFWDKESNHLSTMRYVLDTFDSMDAYQRVCCYWFCLKFKMRNAFSIYEPWWYCWDEEARDRWIYDPPDRSYVITARNNPLEKHNPEQHNLYKLVAQYFSNDGDKRTAIIVGLRADESLNRFRAVTKNGQMGHNWITKTDIKNCFNAYPIYDWDFADIWKYFVDHGIKYNPIYDRMFAKGIFKREMRISQSFCDVSKDAMPFYREIEPESFERFLQRVQGVNSLTHLDLHTIKQKADEISYDFLIQSFPDHIRTMIEKRAKIKDKNVVRALLNNDIRMKRINKPNEHQAQKLIDKYKDV